MKENKKFKYNSSFSMLKKQQLCLLPIIRRKSEAQSMLRRQCQK
jgi:hypothetical protein